MMVHLIRTGRRKDATIAFFHMGGVVQEEPSLNKKVKRLVKAVLSEESSGSLTMKDIRSKVISKLSVEDRENRIRVQALIDSTVALYQRRETKQESPDHKKVMKPIFKKWLGPSWKMTWVSKGFHLWQINMPCQTNIMPCQNAKQTWCEANMSCQHVKPSELDTVRPPLILPP